jgi:hypothetical protein
LGRIEMSGRSRQLALVLLVAIGLAVFLWGCGGGDQGSTTGTSVLKTTRTTVAKTVSSAVEELLLPKLVTNETPEEFRAVVKARPVAILFYVPGNVDDAKVLETFKAVQADFPDYTFWTYDYKDPNSYGDLSMLLEVNYPPEIVLVDKHGVVRDGDRWNGYIDESTLRQCLINVGQR